MLGRATGRVAGAAWSWIATRAHNLDLALRSLVVGPKCFGRRMKALRFLLINAAARIMWRSRSIKLLLAADSGHSRHPGHPVFRGGHPNGPPPRRRSRARGPRPDDLVGPSASRRSASGRAEGVPEGVSWRTPEPPVKANQGEQNQSPCGLERQWPERRSWPPTARYWTCCWLRVAASTPSLQVRQDGQRLHRAPQPSVGVLPPPLRTPASQGRPTLFKRPARRAARAP